jgi:predicted acetyltransferase
MKELFKKYIVKAGFISDKEKGDEMMTPNEQALHIRDRYLQYSYPYQLTSPPAQNYTLTEEMEDNNFQSYVTPTTQTEIPATQATSEFTERTPYFKTPEGTRMGYVIISILLVSAVLIIYGLSRLIG